MARVSLILTVVRGPLPRASEIAPVREALAAAGHEVEVLLATGPGVKGLEPGSRPDGIRWVPCQDRGRVAAAVHGLLHTQGELLVVVDPSQAYTPQDLVRVVSALQAQPEALVLGCRWANGPGAPPAGRMRAWIGELARRAFGTADPFSGLVGLTRPALEAASGSFRAVGSQFALELLGRVWGDRLDVPARPKALRFGGRPGFDDLRHLKRLADDRYGNLSRLLQFCVVGASGMVIDLSTYALFQWVFAQTSLAGRVAPMVGPVDLAVSAVLAIAIALTWNFSLNRRLTFNDARGGSVIRQFLAYALSNAVAISVNLTLRLRLPEYVPFFHRHKLVAAVVGIVLATGLSFSMSRWLVFHRRGRPEPNGVPPRRKPSLSETSLRR